MESVNTIQNLVRLRSICVNINKEPIKSMPLLIELQDLLKKIPEYLLQSTKPIILSSLYPLLIPESIQKFSETHSKHVVDVLSMLFSKIKIEKAELFFNMYAFLLFSIYDPKRNDLVKAVHEEFKLSIITCMSNLFKALSWDLLPIIYKKDNSPKLCQILYICLEIAEKEKLRQLRIAAMECIMVIAKVDSEEMENDVELRKNIADVFMFAFPGLSCKLKNIAVGDFKSGHKVISTALRTWGRLVALLMEDYTPIDQKLSPYKMLQKMIDDNYLKRNKEQGILPIENKQKFENKSEVKDYILKTERTEQWYKETDEKLAVLFGFLAKLITHENFVVKKELHDICSLIFDKCHRNLPQSSVIIIEIMVSSDIDTSTSNLLNLLPEKFLEYEFCALLEKLKKRLMSCILGLPRIFHSLDEVEQQQSLNIIMGYLKLFKKYRCELLDMNLLNEKLLPALMEMCPFEKPDFAILEEIYNKELDENVEQTQPWTKLNFLNKSIEKKYFDIINVLSQDELVYCTTDYYMEIARNCDENKMTAMFLLNKIFENLHKNNSKERFSIVNSVIKFFVDPEFADLPFSTECDRYGYTHSPMEVRNNIIKICLQMESLGNLALCLQIKFADNFLLLTLFEVLQRAGSSNYLIRLAGLHAVKNISKACGHTDISKLIQHYPDFFSYHVTRRIDKLDCNESVLNVVCAVVNLSKADILPSISEIVESIITQSCDKFKEYLATAYLNVFKVFLDFVQKWFDVPQQPRIYKTKKQKDDEIQGFQVSGVEQEYSDYSDSTVMGNKTAEEMYKEDLENYKKQKENKGEDEDDEMDLEGLKECKKPEPPLHIKIAVSILKRSLHFLPSKIKERKVLVLEILKKGVTIIREYEDELLPIVHLIWSPLVGRFQESEPAIINLSFQLLATLAQLSKDFIRHRTSKEVLPGITKRIKALSKESFLKDRGSHYRHTQTFKLQLTILSELPHVVMDLDLNEEDLKKLIDSVIPYLSNKQPLPLQMLCIKFFNLLFFYDNLLLEKLFKDIDKKFVDNEEYKKNINEIVMTKADTNM